MTVTVVLVDLSGVLFQFDHEHRLRVLGACLGLPAERAEALLWESGFSADCDAGIYPDARAVRGQIRRITGYAGTDRELDAAWCSAFRPDPAVVDLVTRRADAVDLGVFSNNGPLEEEVLPRLHPEAFRPFRHSFFGHRLGASKPDAASYRRVAALLGTGGEQIGFADDSDENVEAARACGWQAVRFRVPADLAGLIP